MDRQCAGGTRQMERDQPDPAADGEVEDLGLGFAERVQVAASACLRFAREGRRARRDQELPAHPKTNVAGYFWEYAVGGLRGHQYWAGQIGRLVLEYQLDNDPPLAARAYALQNIATIDAGIACWDSKYTYWAIRPYQLD